MVGEAYGWEEQLSSCTERKDELAKGCTVGEEAWGTSRGHPVSGADVDPNPLKPVDPVQREVG